MVRRALGIRYSGESLQQPIWAAECFDMRACRRWRATSAQGPRLQYWVINPELHQHASVNGSDEFMF
jgi:hypothetical protein